MALDQRRYEDEVVKPLRGRTAQLPDDLVTRYAVEPDMTGPALEKRLREVRAYWNNKARSASHTGQVCQAFLRADEKLRAEHGERLGDPEFWRERRGAGDRARREAVEQLAAELRGFYGDLGLLTREQLAGAAAAHTGLGEAEAAQAAAAAGLAVVPARELPRSSPLPRDAHRAVVDGLVAADAPSIPALLHPDAAGITLLDDPPHGGALDLAAVEARIAAVSRARETTTSGPTKHVLGRLRTAANQGADLRVLALVHLLDPVRTQRAAGAVPAALVRRLEAARLAPAEARRLVVHVLAEAGAGIDPLDEVRALLAEGRPVAAGRLVAGMDPEPAAEARRLLDVRDAEVEGLREQAAAALRAGRPDVAEEKLRAATVVATDRTDLAEQLARVPPAPVDGLDVAGDGTGVRVSWTVPPSHAADTAYRVVRRPDRAPRDADDGTVVAEVVGARYATDPAPPVGRPVHYAVVAARAGEGPTARSAPVGAATTVVPPVADVELVGERGAVVGRWRAHPEVVRVRVLRRDAPSGPVRAEPVEVAAGPRGFTDVDVTEGVEHHYEVTAVYAGEGRELCSAPVSARGGARADAAPVTALAADVDLDGPEPRMCVSWRTPPGAEVEIRVGRTPPPGVHGDRVGAREVGNWGPVLTGVPREDGDRSRIWAPVPGGRVHVAAFTRAPGGLVRGQDAVFDLVTPPTRLHLRHLGEVAVLSWVWPDDAAVVEVRRPGGRERVTHAQYRDSGGHRLPPGTVGTVEVRAVVGSGPDRSVSSPVSVEVHPPSRPVRYTLRQHRHRLRGSRECVVSVPPGQGDGTVEVVLVASEGRVMPLDPADGVELARHRVDLSSPAPVEFSATVPRLRRPFWLRLFPGDGPGDAGGGAGPAPGPDTGPDTGPVDVVLVDPPVAVMKVS